MIADKIARIRKRAHLSQEQFGALLGVTRQSVQRWESGRCAPEMDKLIPIIKLFNLSPEDFVFEAEEKAFYNKEFKPDYAHQHNWECYAAALQTEYNQCIEEGLDITAYQSVFEAVAQLPMDEIKKKLADTLFEAVTHAKTVDKYRYIEPSTIEEIRALRKHAAPLPSAEASEQKIHGAWLGRICGCLLGKTVEGIRTNELIPFLQETDNYPMHRYILRSDLNEERLHKYKFRFADRCYADTCDGMPPDDDTNYIVLAQKLIEKYGRDFTPHDVSRIWMALQPKDAYCTAERVAFCNFVKGYEPPASAAYKNPYREWIGAQIRGDYFGYINPGDPETAADMAFRDACISHVKNGIYGEMFVSAMLAAAACTADIQAIIEAGMGEIPHTSRLHEALTEVLEGYKNGVPQKDCFARIYERFDEYTAHGWCHTISNAMIVAAALLYGEKDFGRSICMAVEAGFDTDCNGATVGSILGMALGVEAIDSVWTEPIHDLLHTTIFGLDQVSISECVKKTMEHLH